MRPGPLAPATRDKPGGAGYHAGSRASRGTLLEFFHLTNL